MFRLVTDFGKSKSDQTLQNCYNRFKREKIVTGLMNYYRKYKKKLNLWPISDFSEDEVHRIMQIIEEITLAGPFAHVDSNIPTVVLHDALFLSFNMSHMTFNTILTIWLLHFRQSYPCLESRATTRIKLYIQSYCEETAAGTC